MVAGIYKIENTLDHKVYIGKSLNIARRLTSHKWALRQESNETGRTNHLLYAAVRKYGLDAFTFETLEEICVTEDDADRQRLSDLEIYYIDKYDSCNRLKGYNFLRESPTNYATKEETRLKLSKQNMAENNPNFGNRWSEAQKQNMSDIKKAQIQTELYDWMRTDAWRLKLSDNAKRLWEDLEKKKRMAHKVAEVKSTLRFYEYDKVTKELKRVWNSMNEILIENPDYLKKAIYSVCNGYKKSYRGSIWKSEKKCDTLQD